MNTETKRTADEIAEDIDAIRQRMDATLDELEVRLRPGAWLRDALGAVGRIDKARYVVPIVTFARKHPGPAIGAGIALIGLGIVRKRHADSRIDNENASLHRLSRAVDAAKGAITGASDIASGATKNARMAIGDGIANAGERSRALARRTGRRLNESSEEALALARRHPVITSGAAIAILAAIAIPFLGKTRH
jgi:hypothetical protein